MGAYTRKKTKQKEKFPFSQSLPKLFLHILCVYTEKVEKQDRRTEEELKKN